MEDRRCRFHATFLVPLSHPSYLSYMSILSLYLSCISSSLMGDRPVWVNARKSLQVGNGAGCSKSRYQAVSGRDLSEMPRESTLSKCVSCSVEGSTEKMWNSRLS